MWSEGTINVLKQLYENITLHPVVLLNSRALRNYEQNYFITELEYFRMLKFGYILSLFLLIFTIIFYWLIFTIHTDFAYLVLWKNVKKS